MLDEDLDASYAPTPPDSPAGADSGAKSRFADVSTPELKTYIAEGMIEKGGILETCGLEKAGQVNDDCADTLIDPPSHVKIPL